MPYFKGVYFENAFHTEADVVRHSEENPAAAEEPVLVQAAPAPVTPEAALETLEVPASEPGLAVPVDRETPIVEMAPAVGPSVEPDPFPSFVPEPEPVTEPAPESKGEVTVADVEQASQVTPAETPDAKKKKSGRRGG